MPRILPIPAIGFAQTIAPRPVEGGDGVTATQTTVDVSRLIAPPYDVLFGDRKAKLLEGSEHNIAAVDLPHLPPKTVGPDEAYERAGQTFAQWLDEGVLVKREKPAFYVYQQTYTVQRGGAEKTFHRRTLLCDISLQAFGPSDDGAGGVFPHEKTFPGAKEDRLKLMRTTGVQMSPIFGLYSDPEEVVGPAMGEVIDSRPADFAGTTHEDGVLHECWVVDDEQGIAGIADLLNGKDVFIADGHHRYNTALNYRQSLEEAEGALPPEHPANTCLFVLVALQDPGMIVLPTHRVLGGMPTFDWDRMLEVAGASLEIKPFAGSLEELEAALPSAGHHAMGLYDGKQMAIATTHSDDPLQATHGDQSEAWRQLDVAILQHLIVEQLLEPTFAPAGEKVTWKFPHELSQAETDVNEPDYQLAVIMQATPLESVRAVSEAGELMPQKSTFFYPKVATGLAMNPLR